MSIKSMHFASQGALGVHRRGAVEADAKVL